MKTKIQKEFLDTGFGFPILLFNFPMIKVRSEWSPKINYNLLSVKLLRALSQKQSRLTGNQIKFIRNYFEMTLKDFAKRFCVTHVSVIRWENSKNCSTSISWATEKDIRLYILFRLDAKAKEIADLYSDLQKITSENQAPINLDLRIALGR